MVSIGLMALGVSLIFDPGMFLDRLVRARFAHAAPAPTPSTGAAGVRIELVDASRFAGDFRPLQAWSLDCAPAPQILASR